MIDTAKLKAAAVACGLHHWKWWTSNSFRRLTFEVGQYTVDGSALSAFVNPCDRHPDVQMASGVQEFIEMCSPATINELLIERDRLLEALSSMVTAYEHEASIDNPALIQARAALAQEQGESDA
jgi:hypothetical protein